MFFLLVGTPVLAGAIALISAGFSLQEKSSDLFFKKFLNVVKGLFKNKSENFSEVPYFSSETVLSQKKSP